MTSFLCPLGCQESMRGFNPDTGKVHTCSRKVRCVDVTRVGPSRVHTSAKAQQFPFIQSGLIHYQIKHLNLPDFHLKAREIVLTQRYRTSEYARFTIHALYPEKVIAMLKNNHTSQC